MPGENGPDDATQPDSDEDHSRADRPWIRGIKILTIGIVAAFLIVGTTHVVRGAFATCPSLTVLPGGTAATDLPVLSLSEVSLRSASYQVDTSASPPVVRRAGQLTGSLPDGMHPWIVERPDPGTIDSTPERNPGDGLLYPVGPIRADSNGCWSMSNTMGYPEIAGITMIDYVALVDDRTNRAFFNDETALPANDLNARGATIITTITIPTR